MQCGDSRSEKGNTLLITLYLKPEKEITEEIILFQSFFFFFYFLVYFFSELFIFIDLTSEEI